MPFAARPEPNAPEDGGQPADDVTIAVCDDAVVFSDGEMLDSSWSMQAVEVGGGGTVDVQYVESGGSPGGYRRIHNHVTGSDTALRAGIRGAHLRADAVYIPSSQGGIRNIVFSQTGQMFDGFGEGLAARLLLEQDGIQYESTVAISNNIRAWTDQDTGPLRAEDFIVPDGSEGHPSFDSDSPMHFGFWSTNSTRSGNDYTITAGIDNWRVEVTPTACP